MALSTRRRILSRAYEVASSDDEDGIGPLLVGKDQDIEGGNADANGGGERLRQAASADTNDALHGVDIMRNSADSEIFTAGANNIQVTQLPVSSNAG